MELNPEGNKETREQMRKDFAEGRAYRDEPK
jgi:hypothetical protein